MRTFERYINRKKVTDIKKYLQDRGLASDEDVRAWCLSQNVEPPLANYFSSDVTVQPEQSAPTEKPRTKANSVEESDPEIWHVPAAERPLRKSSKAGKKATRSVPRKKSTRK